MPGTIVHLGATVLCTHGGQASPTVTSPFVLTIASPYLIAACPGGSYGPCVTGQWLVGSSFVLAGGQPIVLNTSVSVCTPNGTPMNVLMTQSYVSAS